MKAKTICVALTLTLLAALLTACANQAENPASTGESDAMNASSDIANASSVNPDAPLAEEAGVDLLNFIVDPLALSGVTGFSCHYSPAQYRRGNRGELYPFTPGDNDFFECKNTEDYAEEQNVLNQLLIKALARFLVDESTVRPTFRGDTIPKGDSFYVRLHTSNRMWVNLAFFENGEVFASNLDGSELWRCEAINNEQYSALKAALEDIRTQLDKLPIDYQAYIAIHHLSFLPESTVLRLIVLNRGAASLEYASDLKLERLIGEDKWQTLADGGNTLAVNRLEAAAPRKDWRYAIDLTSINGAREIGRYRVLGTLKAGSETLPFILEYEISPDARYISLPYPPEMTPDNKGCHDHYLSMWGYYNPFTENFTERSPLQSFHAYRLFYNMAFAEGKMFEYQAIYNNDYPAELVESTIMRHFLLTPEQIRAQTPTVNDNPSEYYDPIKNVYHFEGDFGNDLSGVVVSDSRRDGDLLILTCDWYDPSDAYERSNELTIRLGKGDFDFVYISNRLL